METSLETIEALAQSAAKQKFESGGTHFVIGLTDEEMKILRARTLEILEELKAQNG